MSVTSPQQINSETENKGSPAVSDRMTAGKKWKIRQNYAQKTAVLQKIGGREWVMVKLNRYITTEQYIKFNDSQNIYYQ